MADEEDYFQVVATGPPPSSAEENVSTGINYLFFLEAGFCACCDLYDMIMKMFAYYILSVQTFFYTIVYDLMKYWLLQGPKDFWFIGGFSGMTEDEICALLMRTGASRYVSGTGKDLCDDIIHQEVTGRTTFILGIIFTMSILFLFNNLPRFIEFVRDCWNYGFEQEKRNRKNRRSQTTQKKNDAYKSFATECVAHLRNNDTTESLSPVVKMRDYLDLILIKSKIKDNSGEHIYPHYKEMIDELHWLPQKWLLRLDNSANVDNMVTNASQSS